MRTVKPGIIVKIRAGGIANLVNSKESPDILLNQMKLRGVKVTVKSRLTTIIPRKRAKFLSGLNPPFFSPKRAMATSWKDKPMLLKIKTRELITGRTARDSMAIRLCPRKKVMIG